MNCSTWLMCSRSNVPLRKATLLVLSMFFFSSSELTAGGARDLPHVITFLRSTSLATDVVFQLMDGKGNIVNGGPHTVSLEFLGGRQLRGATTSMPNLDQNTAMSKSGGPLSSHGEKDQVTQQEMSAILVNSRGRRLGSTDLRSPAARRRNSYTMSIGDRRRVTAAMVPGASSLTHGRFETASGSGYGYTNLTMIHGIFGGRFPTPAKYGYSGSSVFGPNKTSAVAPVTAGFFLNGDLKDASTFYMQSQFGQSTCSGYPCCFSCPGSCFNDTRPSCDVAMDRDLFRDDILESGLGFYPGDYVLPLKVRILSISGPGYNKVDICPSTSKATDLLLNETSNEPNSLFITLTTMDELGDIDFDIFESLKSDARFAQPASAVLVVALFLFLLEI